MNIRKIVYTLIFSGLVSSVGLQAMQDQNQGNPVALVANLTAEQLEQLNWLLNLNRDELIQLLTQALAQPRVAQQEQQRGFLGRVCGAGWWTAKQPLKLSWWLTKGLGKASWWTVKLPIRCLSLTYQHPVEVTAIVVTVGALTIYLIDPSFFGTVSAKAIEMYPRVKEEIANQIRLKYPLVKDKVLGFIGR